MSSPSSITLEIEGMTCAACVSRVERKLNKLDGVDAAVNLATESARVRYDAERVALDELLGAVESAGYRASPALGTRAKRSAQPVRLVAASVLSAPLVALMVPPLQFEGWEWLAFALATPVVLWAGWPFHRAAALNARHAAATMEVHAHEPRPRLRQAGRSASASAASRARCAGSRRWSTTTATAWTC